MASLSLSLPPPPPLSARFIVTGDLDLDDVPYEDLASPEDEMERREERETLKRRELLAQVDFDRYPRALLPPVAHQEERRTGEGAGRGGQEDRGGSGERRTGGEGRERGEEDRRAGVGEGRAGPEAGRGEREGGHGSRTRSPHH